MQLSTGSHPFHIDVLAQTIQPLDIFFVLNIFIVDCSPAIGLPLAYPLGHCYIERMHEAKCT